MATTTITGRTAVTAGNLTGAAVFPVDDANGNTRKATLAQLRTNLLAGGSGFTASDPVVCGATTVSGDVTPSADAGSSSGVVAKQWFQVYSHRYFGGDGGTTLGGTLTVSAGGIIVSAGGASITGGAAISSGAADAFSTTVNGGVLNANFLQSGAFDLVVRMTSAGHFWDLRKLNADGSFSFGYDGAEKGRITNGGVLAWGTTVTTGAGAGNIVLSNGTAYASVNGAGTSVLGLIDLDASNRTRLQLNNAALALNNPSTAASATAGGATALPANPTGYLILTLNGTTNKIPYYNN